MTQAQLLRIRGFNASLSQRGVSFVDEAKHEFVALLQHSPLSEDTFELGPADRQDAAIHVLRSTYSTLEIEENSRVRQPADESAGTEAQVWHVTRIEDNPINVAVVLYCVKDIAE